MKRIAGLAALMFLTGAAAADEDVQRATIAGDGVQRADILAGDYFFRPSHLVLKVNVRTEFRVRAERGLAPHTFVISAPAAGMVADERLSVEPKVIHFTPTLSGRYPFYCNSKLPFLKSHRERGMEGVIEVEE